jgi:hypothetical protein
MAVGARRRLRWKSGPGAGAAELAAFFLRAGKAPLYTDPRA